MSPAAQNTVHTIRLRSEGSFRYTRIFLTIYVKKCILEKDMCARWKNAAHTGSQYPFMNDLTKSGK